MKTFGALVFLIWTGTVSAGEVRDGFHGYPWGTPLAKIDSVTLGSHYFSDSSAGIHMAAYQSTHTVFGECHKVSCLISFTERNLTSAAITGSGFELFKCLDGYLRSNFGVPKSMSTKSAESEKDTVLMFDTYKTRAVLTYDASKETVFLSFEEGATPHLNRMAKLSNKIR